MTSTTEELYATLYRIGSEDEACGDIRQDALDQLLAFKMAEISSDGQPKLTPYGEKCYSVMESGDGRVTEFE